MPDLATEFKSCVEGASVPQLRKNTAAFWKAHSGETARVHTALVRLWESDDHTVRMGVAITLGPVAVERAEAMAFLTDTVAADDDWRVQEALAKGLDWHCAIRGWKASEPLLAEWLRHSHPNVRRAAAEGPRVWTKRDHFRDHPAHALDLLGLARADDSTYVRKSVANALSDISKTHPEPTLAALAGWATEPEAARVVRTACRHLVKTRPEQTEAILAGIRTASAG